MHATDEINHKNLLVHFQKGMERMVVLVMLIALILAAPYLGQLFGKDTTINTKDFNTALAVLEKAKKSQAGDYPDMATNSYKGVYKRYEKCYYTE